MSLIIFDDLIYAITVAIKEVRFDDATQKDFESEVQTVGPRSIMLPHGVTVHSVITEHCCYMGCVQGIVACVRMVADNTHMMSWVSGLVLRPAATHAGGGAAPPEHRRVLGRRHAHEGEQGSNVSDAPMCPFTTSHFDCALAKITVARLRCNAMFRFCVLEYRYPGCDHTIHKQNKRWYDLVLHSKRMHRRGVTGCRHCAPGVCS